MFRQLAAVDGSGRRGGGAALSADLADSPAGAGAAGAGGAPLPAGAADRRRGRAAPQLGQQALLWRPARLIGTALPLTTVCKGRATRM